MTRKEIIDILAKCVRTIEFENYTETVPGEVQAMEGAIELIEDMEDEDDGK